MKANEKELKKTTHNVNKILKNTRIQIAFSTYKTQQIFPNKDKIKPGESSSLIYEFQCEHCQMCYIGETRRQLQRRIKEHIKGQPISEISLHVHPPSENNFKIITRTNLTRIAETLLIKKHTKEGTHLINNNKSSEFLFLF
ncbi:MAG: GIY-YIG nuclease family protein [Bacteroidota bacterium]